MLKRILCCGGLLVLTGCMTVGPDYKRPATDTPAAYRSEEKETRALANTAWWQQSNDPVLNGLVRGRPVFHPGARAAGQGRRVRVQNRRR